MSGIPVPPELAEWAMEYRAGFMHGSVCAKGARKMPFFRGAYAARRGLAWKAGYEDAMSGRGLLKVKTSAKRCRELRGRMLPTRPAPTMTPRTA